MSFHIAEKGIKKGKAVYCGAKIECTLMLADEHMNQEEAIEYNKIFDKNEESKNIEKFGILPSLSRNDFSKKVDLFNNLNNDESIAAKQRRSARKITQSDRAINVDSDKIFWTNVQEELDISEYDDDLQSITMSRFNKAVESEAEITSSLMSSIKDIQGVKLDGLAFRLKSPVSLARKINKQSKEKLLGITDPKIVHSTREKVSAALQDVVRYTFIVENHDKIGDLIVLNAQKLLKEGYLPERSEHSYVPGNSYMDAKIIWVHPDTKESFEIQYHSKTSIIAKNRSHEIYEKLRNTDDVQEKQRLAAESMEVWANMKIPSTLKTMEARTGIKFAEKVRK